MLFTSYIGKDNPGHTYDAHSLNAAVFQFQKDNPGFRCIEADRRNAIAILENDGGTIAKIWA